MIIIASVKQVDSGSATSWIYLHGQLEKLNEFDLCRIETDDEDSPIHCIVNEDNSVEYNVREGIYPCTTLVNGKAYPSKLYLWKTSLSYRGLVSSEEDAEALQYASRRFEEKSDFV